MNLTCLTQLTEQTKTGSETNKYLSELSNYCSHKVLK